MCSAVAVKFPNVNNQEIKVYAGKLHDINHFLFNKMESMPKTSPLLCLPPKNFLDKLIE